jgi:hypothetical protein
VRFLLRETERGLDLRADVRLADAEIQIRPWTPRPTSVRAGMVQPMQMPPQQPSLTMHSGDP